MYNWFECKVRYDKTQENGVIKTVTEPYLVDALSFTEAEERIVKEMEPFISGEFSVSNIRRRRFAETFLYEDGDRYYSARLVFVTLDDKSGGEKRTNVNMLVQASDLREALETVEMEMIKSMVDYHLIGITETAIIDVFPYMEDKDGKAFNQDDHE